VLVVSEESRIGRESIETSWIIKQILGTGVRLFFYLEDVERRLDTAMDKILLSLKNFGAEVEREKVRQRTQDGLLVRFRAGAATGDRCDGYLDVRRDNGFSYRQIAEGQCPDASARYAARLEPSDCDGHPAQPALHRPGGVPAAGSGDAGRDLRGAVPTRCRAPGAVRSRVADH
jgi:hypothetical protein